MPDTDQVRDLREQLAEKDRQLLNLRLELVDANIEKLQAAQQDQEARLRAVETSRTRFETLAWLAFGGGAVSLLNIIARLNGT